VEPRRKTRDRNSTFEDVNDAVLNYVYDELRLGSEIREVAMMLFVTILIISEGQRLTK